MLEAISVDLKLVTWAAWLVLAVALGSFLIQRKDFPFRLSGSLVLVAVLSCAGVELADLLLPHGFATRLVQVTNGITSALCWLAVAAVWRATPKALSLPNLSRMNDLLQAEIRERQRANERSRLLVELAPYPIVMANQNGRIVQVNAQTEQCFGYARTALIGQQVDLLVPPRLREGNTRDPFGACAAVREPGNRTVGELFGLREDGSEFPIEVGVQAVVADRDVLVLIAIVDVTQQKNAEAALKKLADDLQRSNGDLAQFAYVASHDLKEPLRKVSSFCQLLKERYQGQLDADAQRYIDYAVDGSHRMNALITALLELAQVNSRAAANAPVETSEACRVAVDNLSSVIDESGAEVTFGELPVVNGDEAQLTQLFQNLIGNAIKFRGPRPPVVTLDAKRQDGAWLFAVQDNGIGIEPAQHHRVFQIFQRLHTREKYPGTGIGLSICQRIVERHGGRIWIESTPGSGTTFFFTLPPAPSNRELTNRELHTEREAVCHAH